MCRQSGETLIGGKGKDELPQGNPYWQEVPSIKHMGMEFKKDTSAHTSA